MGDTSATENTSGATAGTENKVKLKKELSVASATFVILNLIIGSGIFFKPQALFAATGAPGLGMICLFVSGIITLFGVFCAAELSSSIPKTGGKQVWLEEAFGPMIGYIVGWVESLISMPAIIAILCIAFGDTLTSLLSLPAYLGTPIGCVLCVFLAIINIIGANFSARFGNFFTVIKFIPILVIIFFGLTYGGGGGASNLAPITNPDVSLATGFGAAMLACMYAYEGWIHVGNVAGEMKNPVKDLPKALIFGTVGVIIVYMLIFTADLFVLPADVLAATKTPVTDVAIVLFGKMGGNFLSCAILLSLFCTMNSLLLVYPRVPYAMGVQNKLPFSSFFAKIHPKYGTPVNSILWITAITILLSFSGTYNSLSDMATFILWVFYTLTFVAVIILRKKEPNKERPYKVPLYPVIPIIAILGGVYILVTNLIQQPANVGKGLIIAVLGLPIYFARKNKFKDTSVIDE
ncbi:MAG: amino acid permease [Lachnospiraceae bacterium]